MSTTTNAGQPKRATWESRWTSAQRLEAWAGEMRVNVFRLAAVVLFYANHLVNVYLTRDQAIPAAYHAAVSALVLAWAVGIVAVHLCLVRRWVPPALKYITTGWEIMLITALVVIGQEPRTMLAILFFLVIAASGLRLSLPLVYVATLGSMAGYLFFLGYIRYWLQAPVEQRVPRPQQIVVLLGLGALGILAGQAVRQARRIAEGYAAVATPQEEAWPRG
jgi:hypothetical protein